VAVDQRARPRRIRATESTPPARVAVAPRTIVLFVAVALGAVVLLAGVYVLRTIVIQLIVAVVLAMAAEPLVRFFVRRGAPRGRAVGISFALVAIVLSAFGYLLARPLVDESTRFVHDAPALVQHLSRGDGRLGFLETRFHVVEHTRDAVDSGRLTAAAGPAWGAASSAVQTAGALIFIAFLTLFVQLGGRQWFESLVGLAPERNRARIRRAGSGISTAVGGYVNGNLLISVIAGTVTTLTLLALAGAGAEVTLAVRNTRAGAGAAADITATTSNAAVHVAALDLPGDAAVHLDVRRRPGPALTDGFTFETSTVKLCVVDRPVTSVAVSWPSKTPLSVIARCGFGP